MPIFMSLQTQIRTNITFERLKLISMYRPNTCWKLVCNVQNSKIKFQCSIKYITTSFKYDWLNIVAISHDMHNCNTA